MVSEYELPSYIINTIISVIRQSIPQVFTAILILLSGYLLALVVEYVIKTGLRIINIEYLLKKHKIKTKIFGMDITRVISKFIKYYIFIVFFFLSIGALIQNEELQREFTRAIILNWAPRFLESVAICFLGIVLGEHVSQRVKKSGVAYSNFIAAAANILIIYIAVALSLPLIIIGDSHIILILFLVLPIIIVGGSLGVGLAVALGLAVGLGLKDAIAEISFEYLNLRKKERLIKYKPVNIQRPE